MTRSIARAASAAAALGTEIVAVNPEFGPPSIEGYFDEAFSVPGLLAEMEKSPDMDGYIVACFDDMGLEAARCASEAPVVGIGEAAFHLATIVAGGFSVVTTLSRSTPAIENNLIKYGLATRCRKVRAAEVPVLELDSPGSSARERISAEIRKAIREDRAEAIVLGCAGMADFAAALTEEHGIPVLDGVACAVKLCEAAIALGLRTSKLGGYAAPPTKRYAGLFAPYSRVEKRGEDNGRPSIVGKAP
jgi:allantoin racemase